MLTLPLILISILICLVAGHPVHQPPKRQHFTAIPYSDHTIGFTGTVARPLARHIQLEDHLRLVGRQYNNETTKSTGSNVPIDGIGGGAYYAINITVAAKNYSVILDTGSADLWIRSSNVTCGTASGTTLPLTACAFGPNTLEVNTPGFTSTPSASKFNITYEAGSAVGSAGIANVTVGNISVPQTVLASVNEVRTFYGYGNLDGIFGFANAALLGRVTQENRTRAVYKSWIYKAVELGIVAPFYSIILNRPSFLQEQGPGTVPSIGSITFGGIPSSVKTIGPSVTVPNLLYRNAVGTDNTTSTAWYTLEPDYISIGSRRILSDAVILDTGSPYIVLPLSVATTFNTQIRPVPTFNSTFNTWVLACNATLPELALTVNGTAFSIDREDLIKPLYFNRSEVCFSTIVPGSRGLGNLSIFGAPFLSNVVTTFNIENEEITLSQRERY